jgi:putative transcriptional regulator
MPEISTAVDVKKLRHSLRMSQPEFALSFGFNLATLRRWEQGRREPDKAARTFLTVISRSPEAVITALNGTLASA